MAITAAAAAPAAPGTALATERVTALGVDTAPATTTTATATATPGPGARPALTAEQLRQALAKADPGTRQKLLRLIAGGRTVQQLASGSPAEGAKRRSLVMQLDPVASPDQATRAPAATNAAPTATAARPPSAARAAPATASPARATSDTQRRRAGPARPGEQPLLQIDEHTDLLDAAPRPVDPVARMADLQAQLDQAARPPAPGDTTRSEPLAHKVLFPAYDPARHGDDVHGATRRRHEGPIEGHYPAPRQPFQPRYKHPDGRPMNAQESQVEEVLQTQRCEETLGVLARDGVNGLLLSPRDLDAAVANGVIGAEAAATLWKTWAALRPVIHVIEDDPPPTSEAGTDPAGAIVDDAIESDALPPEGMDASSADTVMPQPADTGTASTASATPAISPAPAAPPGPQTATPAAAPTSTPGPDPAPTAMPPGPSRGPTAPRASNGPVPDTPTLPLPGRHPATVAGPTAPQVASPVPALATGRADTPGPTTPALRLKALLRNLAWVFVAYCVLVTSSRLAVMAWLHWGHWVTG